MIVVPTGDMLCYRVTSETQPKLSYQVDVMANACDCPSFQYDKGPKGGRCKHLSQARDFALDEMLVHIREAHKRKTQP